jgi:hypothetical protein
VTPIEVLPDDVLLVIFDFCVAGTGITKREIEGWQSLVHVCRRWRSVVFGSPRRLNLRLVCTPETPAESLDVWPALRLQIQGTISSYYITNPSSSLDNIIVALGHSDRVCRIELEVDRRSEPQWDRVLATMQVPFPELVDLQLSIPSIYSDTLSVINLIPDTFLGGSAARLQCLKLSCISFPGITKLLLSATHLVELSLSLIPHSGYISPEAMATCISVLTSLVTLSIGFLSSRSRFDLESRSLPPPKRYILPALTSFDFIGVTEYLEGFVTFIDAPQLKYFRINFSFQIDFDTPRLAQFINRTPKLGKRDAHVLFHNNYARVGLLAESGTLEISIPYLVPQQLSSIGQIFNSSLHPLSTVENLYIEDQYSELVWNNNAIENTLWLQLLRPFASVKNLYLSRELVGIAAALQGLVGGRITEVLPSLQNIFVGGLESLGPFQENIGQFVAARQLSSDHRIAVSVWDK